MKALLSAPFVPKGIPQAYAAMQRLILHIYFRTLLITQLIYSFPFCSDKPRKLYILNFMPHKSSTVSVINLASSKNQYLLETIASVQQQTFADFEVLVCHSGCSSYLPEWFENQKDRRLRLLLEEHLDLIQTLNLGIQEVKGEYVAFLKGDDLWHPDKLQKQVFHLEYRSAASLVHSWLTVIDENNKPLGKILKYQLHGRVESEILERNQIGFSSAIVRRYCLHTVGLFNPSLKTNFDWDMWIRLSRCYQFMTIAEPLVYQRQLESGVKDNWLNTEKDFQATIEKAYQDVPDRLLPLKSRSYGYASLSLAWQVLQNKSPDTAIAYHYSRQALEHFPRISFSPEFVRLIVATATLHYLKSDRYLYLLSSIQMVRNWLQIAIDKFKMSAHFILNWMLEEKVRNEKQETRNEG